METWPNSLVRRPPWLQACSVKNKDMESKWAEKKNIPKITMYNRDQKNVTFKLPCLIDTSYASYTREAMYKLNPHWDFFPLFLACWKFFESQVPFLHPHFYLKFAQITILYRFLKYFQMVFPYLSNFCLRYQKVNPVLPGSS